MSSENKKNKIALIVEDSPTQTMHLENLLLQNGFSVICVSNGEEGLRMAQMHMPNIIVLDIELPGMNGLQLCKLLKENHRTQFIPIILLSHFSDRETTRFGFQAGAIEYIPKDNFADEMLIKTLRSKGLTSEAEKT